ncbi:MAG: hypothetical protein WCH62_01575 [Candidatus Omnitrophota bacterium]
MYRCVLLLTLCPTFVYAQIEATERGYVGMPAQGTVTEEPVMSVPEWQLTIDVIRAKAQSLMEENAKLIAEQSSLEAEYKKLQEQIRDWELKNETLRQLLKERRGRTDQQLHIDDLTRQVSMKKGEINNTQEKMFKLQKEVAKVSSRNSKELKQIHLEQQLQKNELGEDHLKEKLQKNKAREKELEQQLDLLKRGQAAGQFNKDSQLSQTQAEQLRKEKEDLQNLINVDNNQAKGERYHQLSLKKRQLEAKIKDFEVQLNQLKAQNSLGLSGNKKKKQLLHQMVQMDNRNNQMRQRITNLREDVVVLREQVSRFERKVNFVKNTK